MATSTLFVLAKLLLGFIVITKGAGWLTEAAVNISTATRIPEVVIGATIVSLSTTMPEFTVSTYAAVTHHPGFAVGNAIGSAICNIGLILGSCLMLRPMAINRLSLTMHQGFIMIGSGLLLMALSLNHVLSQRDSIPLILGMLGYIFYSVKIARSERKREQAREESPHQLKLPVEALRFLAGAACVVLGSRWLVSSAEFIALKLGVPNLIVGITVLALGTSLPEYVTALTATIKGHQDLSVGNIMGANILDIFWVLGGASSLGAIPIQHETTVLDLPVMLLLMVLLSIFAYTGKKLRRFEGVVLFGLYAAYLTTMFIWFRDGGMPIHPGTIG